MYVVTANVSYYPTGPLVPSFLYFDTKMGAFEWEDETAEFFSNYQDAWAMADDIIKGRRKIISGVEVKDIEVKGIEFKEVISVKRNKDYGELEMLMKSNT